MKRLLSSILLVCLLMTFAAPSVLAVDSGTCGENLTWSVEKGVLTISGNGDMENFDGDVPWGDCLHEITTVVVERGVTSVGSYAFGWMPNLTSVILPAGLQEIGSNAFYKAQALESVSLPSGMKRIGTNAFAMCTALKSIEIPEGVTALDSTFADCMSLTKVVLPSTVTAIGKYTFADTALAAIDLPAGLTKLGYGAFRNCALQSVTVPGTVMEVGSGAFYGCANLTSVVLGEGVSQLGDEAFADCKALRAVQLPKSLMSVGNRVFTHGEKDCLGYVGTEDAWAAVTVGEGNDVITEQGVKFHLHTEQVLPAVEATCTEAGLTEGRQCMDCGMVLVEQLPVEKLEHQTELQGEVMASDGKDGYSGDLVCVLCGEVITAGEVLQNPADTEIDAEDATPTPTPTPDEEKPVVPEDPMVELVRKVIFGIVGVAAVLSLIIIRVKTRKSK